MSEFTDRTVLWFAIREATGIELTDEQLDDAIAALKRNRWVLGRWID